MALWDRKNEPELPPELKDKSPQEIVAMLNEAKETKQKLETLAADKTASDSKIAEIQAKLDENNILIEQLKANQKPTEPAKPDDPPNPWLDPDGWLKKGTQETQNIALLSGIMSAKMYARQSLDALDAKIFSKYEKEIDQIMNTGYPPQLRIIPDNWQNALTMVKGRHLKEISTMTSQGGEFFSESASGGRSPEPEPADKLTPEEEEACRIMRWDAKTYLANRGKMQIAKAEKGTVARFTNE